MANRGTSVDGGWKLVSFGLCVFSGSVGVRSIVLCKCSGKVLIGYYILALRKMFYILLITTQDCLVPNVAVRSALSAAAEWQWDDLLLLCGIVFWIIMV